MATESGKKVHLKDVVIRPLWSPSRNCYGWKYFGEISNPQLTDNRVYCIPCLEAAQNKNKNIKETAFFDRSSIKSYSPSSSTSNLTKHLSLAHSIVDAMSIASKSEHTLQKFFSTTPRNPLDVSSATKLKRKFVIDIALLCCRDLLPFDIVSGKGWEDFCLKYGIVADLKEIPCRTTVSRCLDFVYQNCKAEVIKAIRENSPDDVAMTMDQWTDRHRRRPYNTSTLHYWDNDFEAVNLTLKTSYFPKRHTGANILSELDSVIEEFGVQDKTVHVVTDAAANVRKACRLGNYKNFLCLGHGMHNLVFTDGIKKTPDMSALVTKSRNIVKAVRFKANDFKKISKDAAALLESLAFIDESDPYFDEDYDSSESDEGEDDDNLTDQSNGIKTLKLDVVTRWYSTLSMMESLTSRGRQEINVVLQKYGHDDLCLSQYEFKLMEGLCKFWKNFEKISGILSGETYSTINMACVFRCEITSLLEEDENDMHEIAELKDNMRANFEKRFPLTELISVAALLDPRCQNLLDVKTFIKDSGTTAFDLLKKWVKGNVSHSTLSTKVREKKLNFVEELVEKHSTLQHVQKTSTYDADVDREIYLLLSLAGGVEVKHIREFWKSYSKQMPILSKLAKKVLCIPMTSTPSERNFSIAGLIVNIRRSSLLPSNVDKILFIHNNYEFCKKIALKLDDFEM